VPERPIPVHYLHSSTLIGGGNQVLLRLIDGLDRRRYEPGSVLPGVGPMSAQLSNRRVPTFHLDLRAAANRGWSRALAAVRLSTHLYSRHSALVHANDPYTYGLGRRVLTPSATRWICHVHHPDVTAQSLTWSFQSAPARILTPSLHVARLVANALTGGLSALRDRIVPVMNPIDTTFFSPPDGRAPTPSYAEGENGPQHLVMAGAITRHKGQDLFVRVVHDLRARGRSVVGHIIGAVQPGSEAYERSVHELARELGVEPHLRFHGFVSDDHMRSLIRDAYVLVLPTAEEGFGLVLAEAQACGTPVVSTAIAPLDEVVLDGRTGLLVERSVETLTNAVDALLLDRDRRERMSREARAWVVANFSADAFCARVMAVYDAVLRA
jgi:glycosyltransferase involved in cell wall biosynthesis